MKNELVTITADDLATDDYLITDIFAMRQTWVKNAVFRMNKPRKSNGIIFLNGCNGKYTDKNGKGFFAPQKSLICLPFGSEYSVVNLECGMADTDALLIEFNIIQNGKTVTLGESPFIIYGEERVSITDKLNRALSDYLSPLRSPAKLKSDIYDLLATLGTQHRRTHDRKFNAIEPAITLLESCPSDNLTVTQLAAACHISESSFRRSFREYFGKSPVEYKIDIRLEQAKKMLDDGDMTVAEIAEALSFDTAAYLCKLFKKKLGLTPTEFKNRA